MSYNFQLDENEIIEYNKKKEVAASFFSTFKTANNAAINSPNFLHSLLPSFSIKEVFQEDFLKDFGSFVPSWGNSPVDKILNVLYYIFDAKDGVSKLSDLSKEERIEIIDFLFDKFKGEYNIHSLVDNTTGQVVMFSRLGSTGVRASIIEYIIQLLVDRRYYISSTDYFKRLFDEMLSYGNLDNPFKFCENIKKCLKPDVSDYRNFALAFANKNILPETKGNIAKVFCLKKDLPAFISSLRSNVKDLDDIAAFIDATIINNGRVKDKSTSFTKFISRFFLFPNLDYWTTHDVANNRSNSNFKFISEFLNWEEFLTKYKEYFTSSEVIEKLYAELNAPRRSYDEPLAAKNQFIAFYSAIFSVLSLKEVEQLIINNEEALAEVVISDRATSVFSKVLGEKEVIEANKLLATLYLNSVVTSGRFREFFNKLPNLIGNLVAITQNEPNSAFYKLFSGNYTPLTWSSTYFEMYFDLISKENLKREEVNILDKDFLKSLLLGKNYITEVSNCNYYWKKELEKKITDSFDELAVLSNKAEKDKEYAEIFYEKIVKVFEDPEYFANLLNEILKSVSFSTTLTAGYSYSYSRKNTDGLSLFSTPVDNVVDLVLAKVMAFIEIVYNKIEIEDAAERLENLKREISNLVSSLKLAVECM